MKKIYTLIFTAIIFPGLLTGCARTEFMDILGFTERFTYSDIGPENFFIEKNDDGRDAYYTFFKENETDVMLKIICSEYNKTEEVRIYLPKYGENADKKAITSEDIALFLRITSSAVEAFTGCNKSEADDILNQMYLYEKKSYENEGELTKIKNNFHFLYHSADLGSEFIIFNTYLEAVPETEKPESRPMYGDTTKIRTETVPTK